MGGVWDVASRGVARLSGVSDAGLMSHECARGQRLPATMQLSIMTARGETPHRGVGAAVLAAWLAGSLTAALTYFSGLLTLPGSALAAGSVAAAAAILAELPGRRRQGVLWLALLLALAVSASSFIFLRKSAPPDVAELVGGCKPFVVIAQNRWQPIGVTVRKQPLLAGEEVTRHGGNYHLRVDGWVRTQAPYPSNPSPWNSDKWFHLADNSGWVSFAGVRADPTPYDETGLDPNGGRPAPTSEACSGTVRW